MNRKAIGLAVLLAAVPLLIGAAQTENALIAIVNDEAITRLDLEAALFDQGGTDAAALPTQARLSEALDLLIEERLILQAAKQAKLQMEDVFVEERLDEVKKRFPSEAAFEAALAQEGLTPAMLRKRYADQLLMQRVIEQEVRTKIVVTPSEIARYYADHPDEMRSTPRVRGRHILIRATPERSQAEALASAHELREQIAQGDSFAELAKTRSDGPEAAQGGDMGWVTPGQLLPVLDQALFQLQGDAVSEPIQSDLGFHLVQVIEREPVVTWNFEDVAPSIREKIMRQKFEHKLGQWLSDLRAKAYIVIKLDQEHGAQSTM